MFAGKKWLVKQSKASKAQHCNTKVRKNLLIGVALGSSFVSCTFYLTTGLLDQRCMNIHLIDQRTYETANCQSKKCYLVVNLPPDTWFPRALVLSPRGPIYGKGFANGINICLDSWLL